MKILRRLKKLGIRSSKKEKPLTMESLWDELEAMGCDPDLLEANRKLSLEQLKEKLKQKV